MSKKDQIDTFHSDTVVSLKGVSKTYLQQQRSENIREILKNAVRPQKKEIRALDQIDLEIKTGSFVAYAGPNGAGKSTTMKLISGMLMQEKGRIEVFGKNPMRHRIPIMRKMGVLFGHRTELWWDHPIISSFDWKRVVWNIPQKEYEMQLEYLTEYLDLKKILNTFARELSLGQRMKADLAMLLLHRPSLILLDEPTIGLDVVAKQQMIEFLKRLHRDEKTTILVTSHDMDDLENMAQRIVFISEGKIAFDGDFDDLRTQNGSFSRIIVYFETAQNEPLSKLCAQNKLIRLKDRGNDFQLEYAYDSQKMPLRELFNEMGNIPGIRDFELKKAPIEDVIAGLYHKWSS